MGRESKMADMKELMRIKKILDNKRPAFKRDGYGKRIRITSEWRKPRGLHNKMKDHKGGHRRMPMPGFRTNRLVRGLHMTGLLPVRVSTLVDIAMMDKKTQGAIVANGVGNRKRILLIDALNKAGIHILNLKNDHAQKIKDALSLRKKVREDILLQKKEKSKKAEKKEEHKDHKKEELTPEQKAEEEKKTKDKILTKADKK